MITHKFDVQDAKKYGIEKAILLEHLKFHQQANEGNPDLEIDGKAHAFIKPETIKKMYPYLSYGSVRRWLKELEDDGVIESCKPKAKGGYHLKYYHVKSLKNMNAQNETSNEQNDQSMNAQNEHSSILPNAIPNEGFVDSVKNASDKRQLLNVWMKYRKSKGKHMNLYEQEVTLKSSWNDKPIEKIRDSILYTVENGWFSLQEREEKEKPKSEYKIIDGGTW